jgi:hypothetical protein
MSHIVATLFPPQFCDVFATYMQQMKIKGKEQGYPAFLISSGGVSFKVFGSEL